MVNSFFILDDYLTFPISQEVHLVSTIWLYYYLFLRGKALWFESLYNEIDKSRVSIIKYGIFHDHMLKYVLSDFSFQTWWDHLIEKWKFLLMVKIAFSVS